MGSVVDVDDDVVLVLVVAVGARRTALTTSLTPRFRARCAAAGGSNIELSVEWSKTGIYTLLVVAEHVLRRVSPVTPSVTYLS